MRRAFHRADPEAPQPPKEVLDYLRRKGVRPAWNWFDVWKQEHLAAFTVAGVMEKDILADVQASIDQALEAGLPFAGFKKLVTPILADKGWLGRRDSIDPITGEIKEVELGTPQRLKIIFKTNVDMARAAGQWEKIKSTEAALPYLEYRHGTSRVPRPDHLKFDGLILPIDDPFWKTNYPPNAFGCTCFTRQISAWEAKRKGGVSASPELKMVEWRNKKTGEVLLVSEGCAPGFDFNVGIERLKGIRSAE